MVMLLGSPLTICKVACCYPDVKYFHTYLLTALYCLLHIHIMCFDVLETV